MLQQLCALDTELDTLINRAKVGIRKMVAVADLSTLELINRYIEEHEPRVMTIERFVAAFRHDYALRQSNR